VNFPKRLWCHTWFSRLAVSRQHWEAGAAACHEVCRASSRKQSIQRGSAGGVRAQLLPPLLLGTLHVARPPLESTVPSTRNQPLCDISHGAKGSLGSGTAAGTTSAAALLATSSRFLQLPRAAGSHEFSPRPGPAGRVLAGVRHVGQLWVSGPRLWEGAGAALVGFTGGCSLFPLATPKLPKRHVGASVPCQQPGRWHNSPTGLKHKQG